MRRTGIPIIGDVPWGTHFCQFYQDKHDLVDILVPYFKAGLENNELCMWVTSEPLGVEEAKAALAAEVDGLDRYIGKGQIEILDYSQWYTAGGKFESDRVLRGWVDRLEAGTRRGFDGLRLTGNTFWLEKSDWQGFTEYEATVDGVIGQYRMLAICTYCLSKCGAAEIMDVVSNHAFALIKRAGRWEIIESAERKKVEASLRESEERLRMAAASTGLGNWDFDPATGKAVWSDLCKRHFGLPPEREVNYDTFLRGLHPDDREREHRNVQEVLTPGSDGQYHAEYRTIGIEDAQERWIAAMGRAFFDSERRPVRFVGTTLDVTERKRAEEELRRHREWLRVTLTSIGDAVLATDATARITFLNPVAARITGWEQGEALGRPVHEVLRIIDEESGDEAEDIVQRVLHEGRVVSMANHSALVTRDGREVPVEDSAAPIRDAAGNLTGVVVVFHDVTEKRRAHEALRQSEAKYRNLFENMAEEVHFWELVRGERGEIRTWRLVDANPPALRAWGKPLAEVQGKTADDIYGPGATEHYMPVVRKIMTECAACSFEDYFPKLDKHSRFTSVPLGDYFITTGADITGPKKAEQALRKNAEELQALAEHRQLALNASRMGWWHYDPITRIAAWDDRYKEIFAVSGYEQSKDEILTRLHPADLPGVLAKVESALDPVNPQPYSAEYRINLPDGSMRWIEAHGVASFDGVGAGRRATSFVGTVADITQRKQAQVNKDLLADVLGVLNRGGGLQGLISETLRLIRAASGFDAVGLRLRCGEDFPYFEQNGFSQEFVREENFLCTRGPDAGIVRDARGRAVLECTCGVVLSGRTDLGMSCFTEGGSFWTNVSSDLLELAPDADPRANPRNRCIHAGYQSVGLFPVRTGQDIIGLLQLNDRRKGRFTPELIHFYQTVAQNIGLALQRTAAEEALRQSRSDLDRAQAVGQIGSWRLDIGRNVLTWSEENYRMFGVSIGTPLTYETFLEIVHPDDRHNVDARWSAALRGEPYDIEHRLLAGGQVKWVREKAYIEFDQAGNILGGFGITQDITERKQAEEALRRSEKRYRMLYETLQDPFVRVAMDGRILEFNNLYSDLLGYPPEELRALSYVDLTPERWHALEERIVREQIIRRGYSDLYEKEYRRKDGTTVPVQMRTILSRDEAGSPAAMWAIVRDITERKQAEEKIRHHIRILEGINRILSETMVVDTEEDMGRRCLAIAEQVTESKFGFIAEINAEGLLHDIALSDPGWEACRVKQSGSPGKPPGDFKVHGIYGRVVLDGKSLFTNDPASHPDSIGTPEGHPPLNAFLGVPLKHESRTIGMIAVGNRDGGYRPQDLECLEALAVAVVQVLMRKRAERAVREGEERLRQAQKMESIGILAGGIAHDFNNLLTSILGNASLLQMGAAAGDGEQLEAIIESSEKAAALTRQLLAYAGKGQFQITDIDVSRLVRSSADLLRVSTPKNIEVKLEVPRSLPAVKGDSSQIQQVVMNLVINASEAVEGRSGGRVSIRAGVQDLAARTAGRIGSGLPPGRYIFITVSDNGCGMDEKTRPKIFEPFFTTKFTGRGLGLAAVHGILRSHGGAITVDTSPGQGSTFTVYLPCTGDRSVASGPEKTTPAGRRCATVLVVDDEKPVRAFTKAALERLGHAVLLADNGRQALDLLASRDDVELVLVDIIMPVLGGLEALSEMRKKWPNLAVLVASGYSQREACRLGMPRELPFLEKPYTVQMLAAAVERALEGSTPRR